MYQKHRLNTQQSNKLFATEMDFCKGPQRNGGKNFRNDTIKATMAVGKNALEIIEEKLLRRFLHVKRLP
jgi:hypothetical protein